MCVIDRMQEHMCVRGDARACVRERECKSMCVCEGMQEHVCVWDLNGACRRAHFAYIRERVGGRGRGRKRETKSQMDTHMLHEWAGVGRG